MQELEPLVLAALVELDSDEFALGWLLDIVRDACPDAGFDALKRMVLGIVGELLSRDLAQVHLFDGAPTAGAVPAVLDQIRRRWDLVGDRLGLGDVAYLSITAAGRAAVRSATQP
jgi:hypothetical protein